MTMTDPEEITLDDPVMPRARPDSEAARISNFGRQAQEDLRARIDQRQRDHRVAWIIGVVSLSIIAIGAWVLL